MASSGVERVITARALERRKGILRAARDCFLQFGYNKTSLDDIAKRADISRPLIYRAFKNKEEIFGALFEDLFSERYPAAERLLAGRGSPREKLLGLYELLLIEPWDELMGAPMAAEFHEACQRILPAEQARYDRVRLKSTQAILGSKEAAEVFSLAVDGLIGDLPKTPLLRKRLALLAAKFAP
jgi:AcrR family transcriptional regulator